MPSYIQPFGFIFVRVIFTAIIYFVVSFFVKEKVERKDFPRLILCGLFGVALNQLMFFKGLELTSPINASLMMTTNPIMVLIAAAIIMNDKITMRKIAGIIIGIIGASLLLLWGKSFSISEVSVAGDIMILINSLSFGIFLIIVKPLMLKYKTLTVMKWVFLFGSFMVFPFGYSEFTAVEWSNLDTGTWLSIIYVVVAVTTIAYMLNTVALQNLSPSSVSVYIYLQPLFASLFAIVLGNDHPNPLHFIAAIFIFTGVYLTTTTSFREVTGRFNTTKKS